MQAQRGGRGTALPFFDPIFKSQSVQDIFILEDLTYPLSRNGGNKPTYAAQQQRMDQDL